MFCSKCGSVIAADSSFCQKCGAEVIQQDFENQQVEIRQLKTQQKALREAEIDAINSAIVFFTRKKSEYEDYEEAKLYVEYYSLGANSKLLVWGILTAILGFVLLSMDAILVSMGILLFFLPSLLMILGGILMKVNNRVKYNRYIKQRDNLYKVLKDFYATYPDCPVGFEYSNPETLSAIRECILSGRADSIKESLNLLLDESE